jgi:hypothetical protein
MSTITTAILAALLSLPRYAADTETPEARTTRLTTVANSIEDATQRATCSGEFAKLAECKKFWPGRQQDLRALLITIGYFETAYAQHVHEGHCRPHECDGGRARGLWQVQRHGLVPSAAWERIVGADDYSTQISAYLAAKVLGSDLSKCGTIEGAVSMYATGNSCSWDGAKARVDFSNKVSFKLQ